MKKILVIILAVMVFFAGEVRAGLSGDSLGPDSLQGDSLRPDDLSGEKQASSKSVDAPGLDIKEVERRIKEEVEAASKEAPSDKSSDKKEKSK